MHLTPVIIGQPVSDAEKAILTPQYDNAAVELTIGPTSVASAALTPGRHEISGDTDVRWLQNNGSPVALSTSTFLASGAVRHIDVPGVGDNDKVAAIQHADAGVLTISLITAGDG